MKTRFFLTILASFSINFFYSYASADVFTDLQKIYSPVIQGDVLYIKGRIDSHIYDYLSYEAKAIADIRVVELNSLGGQAEWALEIARKLKSLNKITRVKSGEFCASACTYLFAAGAHRQAADDVWFGIHGARLGAGYRTTFQGVCFIEFEEGPPVFEPKKKGCREFLDTWYATAMKLTVDAFTFMEDNGVSPLLRETYFAMPDDEKWYEEYNVIRKPDWVLQASEAIQYDFVTDLLPSAP